MPKTSCAVSWISIHALHEESDLLVNHRVWNIGLISIHALHEESDLVFLAASHGSQFQSTLSMRRATFSHDIVNTPYQFQSTLSMRRATQQTR